MNRVLEHGQYIMGPEVASSRKLRLHRVPNTVSQSWWYEALLISLMALGVGPGDEVITTPFTFVATAEVIVILVPNLFLSTLSPIRNMNAALIEKITNHTGDYSCESVWSTG